MNKNKNFEREPTFANAVIASIMFLYKNEKIWINWIKQKRTIPNRAVALEEIANSAHWRYFIICKCTL